MIKFGKAFYPSFTNSQVKQIERESVCRGEGGGGSVLEWVNMYLAAAGSDSCVGRERGRGKVG